MRLVTCRRSSSEKKIVCSELHERVAIGQRSIRDISNILAVRALGESQLLVFSYRDISDLAALFHFLASISLR